MTQVKRVLFVAYLFPPAGGVGVHRVTKWVKYLPESGWNCSVLTVARPSAPLRDDSLLKDIPPQTIIRRARTLEPSYAAKNLVSASAGEGSRGGGLKRWVKSQVRSLANLVLQPDAQVLWRPAALRAGRRLLREQPHHVIVATGPPFSSFVLGAKLAQFSGLPLVLDYRDEWGISNRYWENKQAGRFSDWVQERQQRSCLRQARGVIATTPASTRQLEELIARAGASAEAACLFNGFDPDDFPVASQTEPRRDYGCGVSKFRLACVGTLWNLNPIGPLVEALLHLHRQSPELLSKLELVCAGRRTADQDAELDRLDGMACSVVRLPFISHDEALALMRTSDANLLLNADLPETYRIINAKTFEYMAARQPIFAVAPPGDLWDILRDLPGTVLCPPRDVPGIARKMTELLQQHFSGSRPSHSTAWDIDRFTRRNLAVELACLLDRLTGRKAGVRPRADESATPGILDSPVSREAVRLAATNHVAPATWRVGLDAPALNIPLHES